MESKWAHANKRTDETKFPSRESVVEFMKLLLEHKFFHRVQKIIVTKEIKKKDYDSADDLHDNKKLKSSGPADKSLEAKKTKKKEKKKVKFDMHPQQVFLDEYEVCSKVNIIY